MASTALQRMIGQQADALDRIAELDLAAPAAILGDATRVVLIGTGTSQHAAELGAMMFEQAGMDARWFPAATGRAGAPARARAMCCWPSRTPRRPPTRREPAPPPWPRACRWCRSPGRGAAGRRRSRPFRPRSPKPTRSATPPRSPCWPGWPTRRPPRAASPADVARAAAQVRAVCADPGIDAVPVPARSLAIVGCGPWGVTAREGALKIREGARLLAEGFDTERFLHGAAVPYTAADGLLLLEPDADPDGLTAAVGVAAEREGMAVAVFGGPAASEPPAGIAPLLAQIPMTVRLQLLAERFARLRGQDPDTAIVGAWADPVLWRLGLPGTD